MKRVLATLLTTALLLAVFPAQTARAQLPPSKFANFETSQTNPIRLSADGTRLYAVNTPNGTLSVFSLAQPASPSLVAEIPVGLDPVSVYPRTNDEAWVVNQVSDSVSVVSVSRGIVTDTLYVPDEPADVVFANGLAYVSSARSNNIRVYDPNTHQPVTSISLFCGSPRALAVSPDSSKVYAACAISGNGTTIIPSNLAPPQLPPTNPSLPKPPQVALIVKWNDPTWSKNIPYQIFDHDVAIISTGAHPTLTGYYDAVGTINLGLGVNPATGDLFVANTDARNLVHFEPNVQGHVVDNRITKIQVATGNISSFDLNPSIDYSVMPNPAALSIALAQPTNVVFDPSGNFLWVAAFGTDRVAQVDTNGNILARVEIAGASGSGSNADPKNKKGPRGLALNAAAHKLYTLNRISNTISVVDTGSLSVSSEIPVGFDPTPTVIKTGRGFLYDAKLSGNGTGACSACHVDGDMDHLAWDLGNPAGNLTSVTQGSQTFTFHPMKGPMTTQPLKGLLNTTPFHWRGDHQDFAAFNPAFNSLLGGSQLSNSDMQLYTSFINTVLYQPNPFENLDRSLPTAVSAALGGGNAQAGQGDFVNLSFIKSGVTGIRLTCNNCHHAVPSGTGTNRLISQSSVQPLKNPQLRNAYQKLLSTPVLTASGVAVIDGFGYDHEGRLFGLQEFFSAPSFGLYTAQQKLDISAYVFTFDTGTAPAVGYTRTLTSTSISNFQVLSDWNLLQNQAAAGNVDLIVRGTINGQIHGLLYSPALNIYVSDAQAVYTQAVLKNFVKGGDILSVMGVYPGTGSATVSRIGPPSN